MSDLSARVEALRGPLLSAFGAAATPEVAQSLRVACDRLFAVVPEGQQAPVRSWRESLDGFESLERDQQQVEIARGLRLCRSIGGAARPRPAAPADPQSAEASPVVLPGIGPKLAERLAERGLDCVADLLWLTPRRYDDVRQVKELSAALAGAEPGERVTAFGTSVSCRFFRRGRRRWVDLRLSGERRDLLVVRWFHAHPGMAKRFPRGSRVALSGRLSVRGGQHEMANPDVLGVRMPDGTLRDTPQKIIPRYPDVPGIAAGTLRRACAVAAERFADRLPDPVPADVAERLELPALAESLSLLHAPPDDLDVDEVAALDRGDSRWHRRLAFEELFVLGLVIARRKLSHRRETATACPALAPAEIARLFPFELTGAQNRAVEQLSADIATDVPMNRLLQGDVGSGKTAVAFAAARQVIASGGQVAMMAPTELLAEQHYSSVKGWCDGAGLRVSLLTASTPKAARTSTLSLLLAGQIDLLVGTHSLLSESVEFHRLGLVVIDEQHRFGVAQRVRLREKGAGRMPHLLVMTATPIPRTLALTAYGDLDVTIIDELPPGREPVVTTVISGARARDQLYRRLGKRIAAGERAFVVCPLIEPSEEEGARDWRDATTTADQLSGRLEGATIGLVHGRLTQSERDAQMSAFRRGEIDVLVATTVVEVGVDVPEATIMIVEDAHRFGLSQLHQLRGRVGRGAGQARCVLITHGRKTEDASRRLAVMADSNDGFRIAEEDLAIRGPGELLGARQAGLPRLRFGNLLQHTELLIAARAEAEALLERCPDLDRPEYAAVRNVLKQRGSETEAYGAEGG